MVRESGQFESCSVLDPSGAARCVLIALSLLVVCHVGRVQGSEYTVEEIASGVFLHRGLHEQMSAANRGDTGNAGFIVGSRSVAVIDPGGSEAVATELKAAIARTTDLPVSHVILSHFHLDHVAGAAVFAHVPQIVSHHHYPRAVAQRAAFYLPRLPELAGQSPTTAFIAPTQLVEASVEIDLGERLLRIEAHPVAHTDNDLTVFDLKTQTLWASDLVFVDRLPSLDGSLTGWLTVLENWSAQTVSLVVPGHGAPAGWDESAGTQLQYLQALRDDVRAALSKGLRLSAVLEPGAIPVTGNWQLIEQQHPVNITKAYTELEWEE